MPGWLFDSVALIDWYCGRSGISPYLEQVLTGRIEGAFSTITEIELWQGLRPGEEDRHTAMLSLLRRVELDEAIARQAGRLRQRIGLQLLSLPDAAIAATAQLTGRTLVTRNTRDFTALQRDLAVEFYPKS
jgi:predicted nucleic acid-binding protein